MILAAVAAESSAETFTGLMDHVAQGFEAGCGPGLQGVLPEPAQHGVGDLAPAAVNRE